MPEEGGTCTSLENYEFYELLNALDEKYRIILILYYVEGFKVREIAQILDLEENTVKTRLSRGRKQLAREYRFEPARCVERYKYPLDENGYPTGEPAVETVDSKFVVVHMKVKNNNEVNPYDDYEVCVSPELKYLKKDADGNYVHSRAADAEYFPANEGYGLQYGISVYFDKMYYTEGTQRLKHFHFVPMDPGEEMEYTLAYVVDEDRLDSAFFQFYSGYDGWPVPEGGNEYVYVKIEQ